MMILNWLYCAMGKKTKEKDEIYNLQFDIQDFQSIFWILSENLFGCVIKSYKNLFEITFDWH